MSVYLQIDPLVVFLDAWLIALAIMTIAGVVVGNNWNPMVRNYGAEDQIVFSLMVSVPSSIIVALALATISAHMELCVHILTH